jgi:hypothetical protein
MSRMIHLSAVEGTVTDTRYFSRKISQSRNADSPHRSTPDACHWCREPFKRGQTRCPIYDSVCHGTGWGLASLCMDCFKVAYDEASKDSGAKLPRCNRQCEGCGQPIQTVVNTRAGHWECCSNRCYQRAYRKRRRGVKSVVQWKLENRKPKCEACKCPIERSKRADARFCSNGCRQWQYRRRGQQR